MVLFLPSKVELLFLIDLLYNNIILDFKDLIDYLRDHGILYKNLCPKFHRVLASRACRSAVMIGAPLTTLQIEKVIFIY